MSGTNQSYFPKFYWELFYYLPWGDEEDNIRLKLIKLNQGIRLIVYNQGIRLVKSNQDIGIFRAGEGMVLVK